jgi:hypothetical protein
VLLWHAPHGRVTLLARPPRRRLSIRFVACSPFMTAHQRRQGWENRSEALAKGFIQVGWAMKSLLSESSGAYLEQQVANVPWLTLRRQELVSRNDQRSLSFLFSNQ